MGKEFKGSRAFLNIPVGVARDKELLKKPKSIILMGEIVSMLNVTGKFYMSNKEIAKRLNCSKSTVNDYLKLLVKRGYIRKETIKNPDTGALVGRSITAGDALVRSTLLGWSSGQHHPSTADNTTLVRSTVHKENNIKEQDNRTINKDIDSSSAQQNEPPIPYQDIINYLNQKTGAHYKPSSKANQRLIKARWNEGYRLDDFKKVIDNKAFDWQNDSKMWKYMRPATLFSASKFDDYLNENDLNSTACNPASGGYDTAPVPDINDISDQDLPF